MASSARFKQTIRRMPRQLDRKLINNPDYVETDPLFKFIEEHWAEPCTNALPPPLHGACLLGPALACALLIMAFVGTLVWCDNRSKAKAALKKEA